MESWRPGRLFPPAVQAGIAGEETLGPVHGPQTNPLLQQGNNSLDGLAGGWKASPSALCFHHLETGCRGESRDRSPLASPIPCLVFHRVGHTVSHLGGQGKQWPQEARLVWGSAALSRTCGRGVERAWYRRAPIRTGLYSPAVTDVFPLENLEDVVLLCLCVSSPSMWPKPGTGVWHN